MNDSHIHHLICTHCTHGTSALVKSSPETFQKVLGYSARASSIPDKATIKQEYCNIERLLSYELPCDTTHEQKKELDSQTAPIRLCFYPDLNGRQILGQISFRTFDTAKRPGSYFAHFLLSSSNQAWSPTNCLRSWGIQDTSGKCGWANKDSDVGFRDLTPLQSIQAWQRSPQVWLTDETTNTFLNSGKAIVGEHSLTHIPKRWSEKIQKSQRIELLQMLLQAVMEKDTHPRAILAMEPVVAAIYFYAALRLLPDSNQKKISFSTYETDFVHSPTDLTATMFFGKGDTFASALENKDVFAVNTFNDSSFIYSGHKPRPGRYATWATECFYASKLSYLEDVFSTMGQCLPSSALPPQILDGVPSALKLCEKLYLDDKITYPRINKALHVFLLQWCVQTITQNISGASRWPSRKTERIISRLEKLFGEFPKQWKSLKALPAVKEWMQAADRSDEDSVLKKLSQPESLVSNQEALRAICDSDCVVNEKRLPRIETKSKRLWGEPRQQTHPSATYNPPSLLIHTLRALQPEQLDSILPKPLPDVSFITGMVRGIEKGMREEGSTSRFLKAHIRTILDQAAGTQSNGFKTGLMPEQFEQLLEETATYSNMYNPEPGNFGTRIKDFIGGFVTRVPEVCKDDRLINLATQWVDSVGDNAKLTHALEGWKLLISYYAKSDPTGTIPFWSFNSYQPSSNGNDNTARIKEWPKMILPDAGSIEHRKMMISILQTYQRHGLLPIKRKKGWFGKKNKSSPDKHLIELTIEQIYGK